MDNIIKSISTIILVATMMTTNVFCEENILAGEDRFETAIKISNSWKKSQEAILVNSTATSDLLCATVLSSQIDCPILLTNKNKINESTINEIKRLDVNKLYLIGGEDVINKSIEPQLNKENISIERIAGETRYETSINIANKVNKLKKSDTVVLINGDYSVADAVSISPVAGNKNMPVIICKEKEVQAQIEWIKNNNIKNSYIIGGEDVIHETIEKDLKNNNINTKRIYGKDRYETNANIIKNFYKESKINKLFYCKGQYLNKEDEIIDGMLVASLASKEKSPIILLGENLSKYQEDLIKKKDIKNLIQVGYGVSEGAKNELYKLKESYTPENPVWLPTSKPNTPQKPNKPETPPIVEIEKPNEPEMPPIVETEKPNEPEMPPIVEIEKPNTPEIPPIIEIEKPNKPEAIPPENIETPSNPEEVSPIENLKYINHTIDDDKKNIIINFNNDIHTSKENKKELKDSIKIIIDKNNIKNNQIKEDKSNENNQYSEEKYIKLNKYDNIKIEGQSLIIELDDELIGKNSSIVISKDTIKDFDNNYLEELRIENIQGINKNIVFVKTEEELNKYINDKEVDIIKLENNITIFKDLNFTIKNEVIIDGSNGEENFKISNIANTLKEILIIDDKIILKNVDLEGMYIEILNKEYITLKNMNIDLKDKTLIKPNENNIRIDKSGIEIHKSIVTCKDLIIQSNKSGIEVIGSSLSDILSKRTTLNIDGYVYNEKIDEKGNYKPSIILENRNKDIESNKLNHIIIKDNSIEDLYNKEILNSNEDETISDKYYEIYYKKIY